MIKSFSRHQEHVKKMEISLHEMLYVYKTCKENVKIFARNNNV